MMESHRLMKSYRPTSSASSNAKQIIKSQAAGLTIECRASPEGIKWGVFTSQNVTNDFTWKIDI
jgi:hypothetical protein